MLRGVFHVQCLVYGFVSNPHPYVCIIYDGSNVFDHAHCHAYCKGSISGSIGIAYIEVCFSILEGLYCPHLLYCYLDVEDTQITATSLPQDQGGLSELLARFGQNGPSLDYQLVR